MIKKILFSSAILPLVLSGSIFAAYGNSKTLEEVTTKMDQVGTVNVSDTFGTYMTNASPNINGADVFVRADALYWKAYVAGTDYAYSDDTSFVIAPVSGRNKDVSFSFDWGLRAGLGMNFDESGWDTSLTYTYFNTGGSHNYTSGAGNTAMQLRAYPDITELETSDSFQFCEKASSKVDFNINAFDLEFARSYYNSSKLSFRPHFGLKGVWIDLDQGITYAGGQQFGAILGLVNENVKVSDGNRFGGIGPRGGVNSKWYLTNGFSIFGNFAGSFMWGNLKVQHKEKYSRNPDRDKVSITANLKQFTPNLDMQLGLVFDKYLNNNQQHLSIAAGFDAQYYFRVNQMLIVDQMTSSDYPYFSYKRPGKDASLHGLTLSAKLDF